MIVDVFRLETMKDVNSFDSILRGVFFINREDMGQFSITIDYIFEGFTPTQIYLHIEDEIVPDIIAYLEDKKVDE